MISHEDFIVILKALLFTGSVVGLVALIVKIFQYRARVNNLEITIRWLVTDMLTATAVLRSVAERVGYTVEIVDQSILKSPSTIISRSIIFRKGKDQIGISLAWENYPKKPAIWIRTSNLSEHAHTRKLAFFELEKAIEVVAAYLDQRLSTK